MVAKVDRHAKEWHLALYKVVANVWIMSDMLLIIPNERPAMVFRCQISTVKLLTDINKKMNALGVLQGHRNFSVVQYISFT